MTHQAVPRCTSALARLNSPVQGAHNPQGARRIRKAAKPPTAAQGTPLQTQSVGTFYRYPVRPGSASPRLPRVQSTLAMTSLWRLPFYRQPVSCAGAAPGPAVPSPTRRVRLPGSWYQSAVTPRDCHGPCGASPGASGGTKPPQRSSPLRRQLFRKNQMRATPEAFAASATAAATALPTRGSNAFGMI